MHRLKIAVIGSGISGLSAAWLLSRRHDVTLYEANRHVGGHSNTVDCRIGGKTVPVDTGFIVYNEMTYPNLTALFRYLDVETAPTVMGFAVSLDGGRYEYSGQTPLHLLGCTRNLRDAGHWRMMADLIRFFRKGPEAVRRHDESTTLAQFLAAEGYSRDFLDRHLLPMAGAIWSSHPASMEDYPARAFMRFCDNHGLLKFTGRPIWRTVRGGSREYVKRLLEDSPIVVHTNAPVLSLSRSAEHVRLVARGHAPQHFDQVVVASHADQALAMLEDATKEERRCLSAFPYSHNRAILHRDSSLMPRRRRLWSSWNYLAHGDGGPTGCTVTYWMNELQPLETSTDLFVTLNPARDPDPSLVEAEFDYQHPVFTPEAMAMQKEMWSIQGRNRVWFAGAHFGSGFHEDGLQSGLAVAEQLGNVERPWRLADPSGRIVVKPVETEPFLQPELVL